MFRFLLTALPTVLLAATISTSIQAYSIQVLGVPGAEAMPYRKSTPASAVASNNRWNLATTGGYTQLCGGASTVDMPAYLSSTDVIDDTLSAMQAWNGVSGSQWLFDTTSLGEANNRNSSCVDNIQDIYWFDEAGTTLASTWTSSTNNDYMRNGADIGFNVYHSWSDTGQPGSAFRDVMIHELGHAMGVGHTANSSAIMYPVYRGTSSPQEDDRRAVQYLYGSELQLSAVTLPATMTLGVPSTLTFKARFAGGTVTPAATRLLLNLSVVGDAAVAILDSDPQWSTVALISPGQTLEDTRLMPTVTATDKGVEARVSNPAAFVDRDWYVSIQVTPNTLSSIEVRWRSNYLDDTAQHENAGGGAYGWKALGDLVPRVHLNNANVVLDQQGYPAQRAVIPVADSVSYDLQVTSAGATGVAITSSNGFGGTTDYTVAVPGGQTAELTAPPSSGYADFIGWDGCTTASSTSCSITPSGNTTVTANYQVPLTFLDVKSSGVSGVTISSSTGHGGTTDYGYQLPVGTSISLLAPAEQGDYRFAGWTGCSSVADRECSVLLTGPTTVTAEYQLLECEPPLLPASYFSDDMESGSPGWTVETSVGSDTWSLDTSDAVSPVTSWRGLDVPTVSDQRLITPAVTVPAGVTGLTLEFSSQYALEGDGATTCYDGGVLEYSTDNGSQWWRVENQRLMTTPYDAPIHSSSGNPLASEDAWCGTRNWRLAKVDLSGLEDNTLLFRFRLVTDSSQALDDWHIDDVNVRGCAPPPPSDVLLHDGFEAR